MTHSQGHTANMWQIRDENTGLSDCESLPCADLLSVVAYRALALEPALPFGPL